jgi:hypothetical protein
MVSRPPRREKVILCHQRVIDLGGVRITTEVVPPEGPEEKSPPYEGTGGVFL